MPSIDGSALGLPSIPGLLLAMLCVVLVDLAADLLDPRGGNHETA